MRPERVDQLKGDIEAFFPFWGVVEPAVVYLLVNGKQKPDSMVQVKFVSLLDTYGLPPFIAIDELSKTDQIQHGWPEDFPFKSDNLLIRSVIVVGESFTHWNQKTSNNVFAYKLSVHSRKLKVGAGCNAENIGRGSFLIL